MLDAEIDGVDASQWITDRALNYLNAYYYISDKFSEYGLELTEDDQTQIDNTTTNFWTYYQSTFEETWALPGTPSPKAYSRVHVKFQKVMQAMYGEGGELALADGELEDYFTETYLQLRILLRAADHHQRRRRERDPHLGRAGGHPGRSWRPTRIASTRAT